MLHQNVGNSQTNKFNDDVYLSNQNLSGGIFHEDVHLDTLVIWRIGTWGLHTANPWILKHPTSTCTQMSEHSFISASNENLPRNRKIQNTLSFLQAMRTCLVTGKFTNQQLFFFLFFFRSATRAHEPGSEALFPSCMYNNPNTSHIRGPFCTVVLL